MLVIDLTTKRMRRFVSLFAIALAVMLSSNVLTSAQSEPFEPQESGLGYSEVPFELIENIDEAIGTTALEAVQTASADDKPIELDRIVVQGDYALMTVTYNYIGISAIAKRQGSGWQFVCRAGGLMAPAEMVERCEVPSAIAQSLYANFLETPAR